jgi:hypothetical protein
MDEGQGYSGKLKGFVPRVVVTKYEDNIPRNGHDNGCLCFNPSINDSHFHIFI